MLQGWEEKLTLNIYRVPILSRARFGKENFVAKNLKNKVWVSDTKYGREGDRERKLSFSFCKIVVIKV